MFNLNKSIIFLLVAFSYTNAASNNSKEFLSAFLGVIYGKELQFDKDCLGGEVEKDLNELYQSITKVDISGIVINLKKLIKLEEEKCPVEESVIIYNDFKIAMRNGSLIKNSLRNHSLIKFKIREFLDSDKSMRQLGLFLGYVTEMIVYGTPLTNYGANLENRIKKD